MAIHSSTFDFWRDEGVKYIIPGGSGIFPEGWDPRPFLILLSAGQETVEFGSGVGRLAGLFDPKLYKGIDINPNAVDMARKNQPNHTFDVIQNFEQPLPDAPFYFTYTVFLHIDDETLPQIIQKIPKSCKRFCIAEIMGREWRLDKQANPPVFCRNADEYVELMKPAGFQLTGHFAFPYIHYYRKVYMDPALQAKIEAAQKAGHRPVNTNIDFLLFYRD